QLPGDVEGGRFTLDVRVGRENHLANLRRHTLDQPLGVDLVGADSLQRRECPPEDVVAAPVLARFLDRRDLAPLLYDAEKRRVALRIGAAVARVFLGQRVADRAALDRLPRLRDRLGQALRLLLRRPQEVVGQPRRALSADARKSLQLRRQPLEGLRDAPQRIPGIMPPSIEAVFFCPASSPRREASREAASTRSWRVSTSFGSTQVGSMRTESISFVPDISTVTIPPPADASTRRASSSSCIFDCIAWAWA